MKFQKKLKLKYVTLDFDFRQWDLNKSAKVLLMEYAESLVNVFYKVLGPIFAIFLITSLNFLWGIPFCVWLMFDMKLSLREKE